MENRFGGYVAILAVFAAGLLTFCQTTAPSGPCHPNPCTEPNKSQCTDSGGTAVCDCDPGYESDPNGLCVVKKFQWAELTAGNSHTCGVATDGRAFCFGLDDFGQLGNGGGSVLSQLPLPVDVHGLTPAVSLTALTAGNSHTCGVATDGRAFCWGSDYSGQLGNGGASVDSQVPVLVDVRGLTPPVSFSSLAAGNSHTCGVATDGRAFCWGSDYSGQLGNGGASVDSQVPVLVDVRGLTPAVSFSSLAAGNSHTCGVATDGRAFCFGADDSGQLGNGGVSVDSQVPLLVDVRGLTPAVSFSALTAGSSHTCGLATDGRAFCFGADDSGQLGNGGVSVDSQVPLLVDVRGLTPAVSFTALAAGNSHTCGVATDGRAFCFGADDSGQLGNGGGSVLSEVPLPVDVRGIP